MTVACSKHTKRIAKHFYAASAAIMLAVSPALADPQGTYAVKGLNPSDGSTYEGTVTVERTGTTYSVSWDIAGKQFIGVGIGAAPTDTGILVGDADTRDNALSVGYTSDGTYGQVFVAEQPDGTWKGVWAYGGGDTIGTETWTRK